MLPWLHSRDAPHTEAVQIISLLEGHLVCHDPLSINKCGPEELSASVRLELHNIGCWRSDRASCGHGSAIFHLSAEVGPLCVRADESGWKLS